MGSLLSCCGTSNTNDTEPGFLRPQTRPATAKASTDNGRTDDKSTQEVITRQVYSPTGGYRNPGASTEDFNSADSSHCQFVRHSDPNAHTNASYPRTGMPSQAGGYGKQAALTGDTASTSKELEDYQKRIGTANPRQKFAQSNNGRGGYGKQAALTEDTPSTSKELEDYQKWMGTAKPRQKFAQSNNGRDGYEKTAQENDERHQSAILLRPRNTRTSLTAHSLYPKPCKDFA